MSRPRTTHDLIIIIHARTRARVGVMTLTDPKNLGLLLQVDLLKEFRLLFFHSLGPCAIAFKHLVEILVVGIELVASGADGRERITCFYVRMRSEIARKDILPWFIVLEGKKETMIHFDGVQQPFISVGS